MIKMVLCICVWCGKEFNRPPSGINKHTFCTTKCSRTWQKENALKGVQHPQYKRVELICDECGKKYQRTPNRANRGKKNYCSTECKLVVFKRENPNKGKSKTVKCGWCKKEITLSPALVKRHNFCNYDCRGKWYSMHYSGGNSPQYRDGNSKTRQKGRMWRTVSRIIKERDGNMCRVCGKKENLVVHHIIPRYEWNSPEESMLHWNLITLCNSCHGKVTCNDEVFLDEEGWVEAREYMEQFPVTSGDESSVIKDM